MTRRNSSLISIGGESAALTAKAQTAGAHLTTTTQEKHSQSHRLNADKEKEHGHCRNEKVGQQSKLQGSPSRLSQSTWKCSYIPRRGASRIPDDPTLNNNQTYSDNSTKTADARRRSNSLEEEGQNEGQTERDKRLWLIHQKRQLRTMDLDALRRRIVTLEREMHESGGTRSGLPMPTTFDGTTDLQDYLKSFNLIATAHNWTPARCVQVLPLFLRGSARAIYEGIGSDIKDNWRSLIDAMADKLKQMSPSLTARQKLAQRKQLTGESLEEFAQAIRNLVLRAYPDNSLEMDLGNLVLGALENDVKHANEARLRQFRSEIARDFFRANMAPRLKERVMYMEEPQTLEEAVAQARRVEQVQGNLADDMWKNTQDAKAEVALAEVNAEITPKDRTNKTFGEETTQKDKINQIFGGAILNFGQFAEGISRQGDSQDTPGDSTHTEEDLIRAALTLTSHRLAATSKEQTTMAIFNRTSTKTKIGQEDADQQVLTEGAEEVMPIEDELAGA
ncbi:hypothetical protein niasHS_015510 [Heterodera schachtii]|uniref:Gag protein n=1 Tax=Heterodera schachtii TaxID=97005 RepID=A0ABD2HX72_HETSC